MEAMGTQRAAVVMAGGSGERFWPLSRRLRPKQFLSITGSGKAMVVEALERLGQTFAEDSVFLATVPHLKAPMLAHLPDFKSDRVFAEPAKRNTCGCLVWATAQLLATGVRPEDLVLAVTTADHHIAPPERFKATVEAALEIAEGSDHLVTIGIPPTRPDTAFGYVEADFERPLPTSTACRAFRVRRFHEKPALELAKSYVARKEFYWNSGMFFWRVSTFLAELEKTAPEIRRILDQLSEVLAQPVSPDRDRRAEDIFCELPDISIDYALMERAKNVAIVEATFEWDDLGSWDALARFMEKDADGNASSGDSLLLNSADCTVYNVSENTTACVVGGSGLLIVVTDDAVLVCNRDQAQQVRDVVGKLKARNNPKT
jgi:mannose-1-phosphate guanylyltransferase